jgi:small subunit ribosomal protein S8
MKDFLSDFISRINNAQRIELPETTMISFLPNKYIEILKILYDEGYIRGYKQNFNVSTQKKTITVLLKYNVRGEPIMRNLKQISRPGRRIFASTLTL